MKIYIAGKITGLPIEAAFAAFEKAERHLRDEGHEPVNPMKLPHNHGRTWAEYMRECFNALKECEAIYMMPGYINSIGACAEHEVARSLRLKVIYATC